MDAITLNGHKKVLGILYIISATLTIFGMLMLNAFLSVIFSIAFKEVEPEEREIMELILSLVRYVPAIVIILFSIPTLIAGVGLITRQRWATLFAMIMGCIKLFSFPIGTAIGIYAIWIYAEDQKLSNAPATT